MGLNTMNFSDKKSSFELFMNIFVVVISDFFISCNHSFWCAGYNENCFTRNEILVFFGPDLFFSCHSGLGETFRKVGNI